jgi:hypothetical protein
MKRWVSGDRTSLRLMADAGPGMIYCRARELRFPDAATDLVYTRFWRIVGRMSARRSSPLERNEIEVIVESCFARVESKLLKCVLELNESIDEASARRALNLPPMGCIPSRRRLRVVSSNLRPSKTLNSFLPDRGSVADRRVVG